MDDLIASFRQVIPRSGYIIQLLETIDLSVDKSDTSARMVESLIWPGGRDTFTSYEPLVDQPALFYKFADLGYTPSNDEIRNFANRYGWLGKIESVVDPAELLNQHGDAPFHQKILSAELLEHWLQQLNHFIPYMELWEAASSDDQEYLASVIHWYDDYESVSYGKPGVGSMLIASANSDKELLQSFAPGEMVRPAKVTLTRAINRNLGKLCSPALLFNERSYSESHLYFVCKNLLGVIWLQFAKAVASNVEYRRCVECSQPFIPHLGERGKKKKFCTDACKSKNYRNKLKQSKSNKSKQNMH